MNTIFLNLQIFAILNIGEGRDVVHAQAEDLHVAQLSQDAHVGQVGAPAVQLLHVGHVGHPRAGHDHLLRQLHHGRHFRVETI